MMHDFTTDQRPGFLQLATTLVPDAEALLPKIAGPHDSAAYADCGRKLFPIHTKDATILSAAYAKWASVELDEFTKSRLDQACEVFGVTLPDDGMPKSAAAEAAPYGLTVKDGSSESHHYPLHSGGAVAASSYELADDFFVHHKLPPSWYREAAREICKAASVLGVPDALLQPDVVAAGTEVLPDFEKAAAYAKARSFGHAPPEAVEIYEDLVKCASENPADLDAVMDTIYDLDRSIGIHYSSILPDPVAMFDGPLDADFQKAANAHVCIADVMVPAAEVSARFSAPALRPYVGADHLTKLSSVVALAKEGRGLDASAAMSALEPEVQTVFLQHLVQAAA